MNLMSTNKKSPFAWALLTLLFILVGLITLVILGPLIYSGGAAFIETLSEEETIMSMEFTLICSLISTCLSAIMALLTAYCIYRFTYRFRQFFELFFTIPMVLPPIVLGLSLLIVLGPLFGTQLSKIGINFVFTPLGVVCAQFFVALPVMTKLFIAVFDSVPASVFEAAKLDGADEAKILLLIILPMCKSPLVSGVMMGFARAIGEFGVTMMLAGIVSGKTVTLPSAIYLHIANGEMNSAIASAMILVIISMTCLGLMTFINRRPKADFTF